MTPAQFYTVIMEPSARAMMQASMPVDMDSAASRVLLLAIAGQESGWTSRIQIPGGQARGFWQCESGGMLAGVMTGQKAALGRILNRYSFPGDRPSLFAALAWNDVLAYTVARLGLWMDPHALPLSGDENGAWQVYDRVWRPGKPSRDRWSVVYPQAVQAVLFMSS